MAAAIVGLLAILGGTAVVAEPALAVGCYGDWCSGQDPQDTGCANGAKTVAEARVKVHYTQVGGDPAGRDEDIGKVELRWSPTCQTNWARFTAERSSYVSQVWVTQDTNYRQIKVTKGLIGNTEPGTFWTPMIYSPVRKAAARVVCVGSTPDGSCGWLNETAWV